MDVTSLSPYCKDINTLKNCRILRDEVDMVTLYVESKGINTFEYYMEDNDKKKYYKDRKMERIWSNTLWGFWV